MKKLFIYFILFFSVFLLPFGVFADSGKSTIVMDVNSGRVLYSRDSNTKRLIASITKIMTCLVTLENANMDNIVTVGDEVSKMYGTNIYIEVGEKMSIKDLVYGLMLRSGNDAAMVLAVNVFGSEEKFIKAMNDKAKEIGMKNTVFRNPHGLDEDTKNYSTAYDMAILSSYAYKNKLYREIVGTKRYVCKSNLKSYAWYNRMTLLNNYKKCLGGKNGYTPNAGKTLVSLAKKDDLLLTVVSLDDADIYDNHESLYNKYFNSYKMYTIIDKDDFYVDSNFALGEVYIKESFKYPFTEEELKDVSTVVMLDKESKGKVCGKVIIKFRDKEIGRVDVFRKDNKKEEISFFQRIKNLILR